MNYEENQYSQRDHMALDAAGGHFSRHMSAMTGEALESKSAIAAELAWRDMELARERALNAEMRAKMDMGYVLVPKVATQYMLQMGHRAFGHVRGTWNAMVSAGLRGDPANHPVEEEKEEISDQQLRTMWKTEGGRFHGPNVETGTMPESLLLPFLRKLINTPEQ